MKHSGIGIASFALSLFAGLALLLAFGTVIWVFSSTADVYEATARATYIVANVILWVLPLEIAALAFGILALFFHDRKKTLAVIGLMLSGVPLLGFGIFVLMTDPPPDRTSYLDAPPDAIRYIVRWTEEGVSFHHEEADRETIGELRVPADRPIMLSFVEPSETWEFTVPAFRVQREILEGRAAAIWFVATEPGSYEILVRRGPEDADYEPAVHVVVER